LRVYIKTKEKTNGMIKREREKEKENEI